jgi:hypothetical protein
MACKARSISWHISDVVATLQNLNVHVHHFIDELNKRRVAGIPSEKCEQNSHD